MQFGGDGDGVGGGGVVLVDIRYFLSHAFSTASISFQTGWDKASALLASSITTDAFVHGNARRSHRLVRPHRPDITNVGGTRNATASRYRVVDH